MFKQTTLAAGVMGIMFSLCCAVPAIAQSADSARYNEALSPPWQHDANNDVVNRGLDFTEPDADNLADFHGNPIDPRLILYVGGNYFFAMAPLVQAFEKLHPQYKGRIYWETLPPGLLMKQLKAGGTVTVGNMTWTVKPDVYLAGLKKVQQYVDDGTLQAPAVAYVTNTLTIMVGKGNPKHISQLTDLARPDIALAMPNPAFEGIARQIKESLTKAGGPALATMVYETKLKDGSTRLTHIHHRQTPLWIMQGRADAGVTWQSEALFQEQAGHPIAHINIPASENSTAVYGGAVVKGAAHERAGREWLQFVRSPTGLTIFERYGFKPYQGPGTPEPAPAKPPTASTTATVPAVNPPTPTLFSPPPESAMPTDDFGKMVSLGKQIFEHTAQNAPAYVGNQLNCSSCHLDAGRKAGAAPLWAAYVSYPAYRTKNKHVNTFEERLQECFLFSMNGKTPPLGDKTLVALESYSYWLAKGAPIDPKLPGRGYPKLADPAVPADYARGQKVYIENCSMCHAIDGAGQVAADGSMIFPALWGPKSFNWGAGMGSLKNAAPFIKANMPLGRGNSLSDQDAWDVALYMDSQDRPQDPRFVGSAEETRARFHDSASSMYGKTVNGHVLGSQSVPPGGTLQGNMRP